MGANSAAWEAAGVPVVILIGTLLHFAFGWSGRNPLVGIVAPVNESVWEHLKMVFWPSAAYTVLALVTVQGLAPNFLAAKAVGVYTMAAVMLGLYFLTVVTTGEIGAVARLVVDGLTFVVAVVVGQLVTFALLGPAPDGFDATTAGIAAFAVGAAVLGLTTFFPPRRPLFRDQQDGTFGIRRRQ